jgi:hypothetical protein
MQGVIASKSLHASRCRGLPERSSASACSSAVQTGEMGSEISVIATPEISGPLEPAAEIMIKP